MAPRFCGTRDPAVRQALAAPVGCNCCVNPDWVARNFDLEALAARRAPPPPRPSSRDARRLRPASAAAGKEGDDKADVIFVARRVISVEPDDDGLLEAIAARAGRIVAVGSREAVSARWSGPETRFVDFGEATVVPGFVEPHMHPLMWGTFSEGVDCGAEACGDSHQTMLDRLTERARSTPDGGWIRAWNYEYSALDSRRPVTRAELDECAGGGGRKVVIDDCSGHVFFCSTQVFEDFGVDVSKPPPDPPGGTFVLQQDGQVSSEVQEMARTFVEFPKKGYEDMLRIGKLASDKLLRVGVTTVVDAGCGFVSGPNDYAVYDELTGSDDITVRFVAMPIDAFFAAAGAATTQTLITQFPPIPDTMRHLGDSFKIGPQKLMSDGSIQRFTACLNASATTGKRYVHPDLPSDHNGKPTLEADQLAAAVLAVHQAGQQVAVHANGDGALDATLDAIENALALHPRKDHRHRVEHCQLPSEEQLDRIARLGVCPSFFTNHIYYWGDWHVEATVGPERAARMDPLASATKRGIRWSTHCDAPVTAPSPLFGIWAAANRRTREGVVLGEEQRVPPATALRGVTIDAAFQVFAEEDRGSLREGKLCDLAVLSRDPTLTDDASMRGIRDIPVIATVLGGEVAYSSVNASAL